MTPDRSKIINGHYITEHYWVGKMVVYIDHNATDMTFEQACAWAESQS